jgi:60 kDa SS-A/Ro ribonucleoprotein
MMKNYGEALNEKKTPQRQKARPDQVKNAAGGFVFKLGDWDRLNRFLVLGAEGGTYYVKERNLTIENAEGVIRCIKEDGPTVVQRAIEISVGGRAPKNDPAIFVLALAVKHGNDETRKAVYANMHRVCRIGTHLFQFADTLKSLGHKLGSGRGLKTAMQNWYLKKDIDKLAYQVVKYQQRANWSHRDVLRMVRPKTEDAERNAIFQWIAKGANPDIALPKILDGFERAKTVKKRTSMLRIIKECGLTREMIPTEWQKDLAIQEAMLQGMPMHAMIRNLGSMTASGLLVPNSACARLVRQRLVDQIKLNKARVHPIAVLKAAKVYAQGHGFRGKLSWTPNQRIIDSLDEAFYKSFGSVLPTRKRMMLALDVSGSMANQWIAGLDNLITAREASAAMALVTARVEPEYLIVAFDTRGSFRKDRNARSIYGRHGDGIWEPGISPRMRVDEVIKKTDGWRGGGTDCALPMIYAEAKNIKVDTFVIYTDNETWAGNVHPYVALKNYRESSGIPDAKLIVVGMTSSGFTVADPNDPLMLDVVGFDTATPSVISAFTEGNLYEGPMKTDG